MTCGIYLITNKVTGKVYVGQSNNVEQRLAAHKCSLRTNDGKENHHLQNSWNKYGENNFRFSIIEECGESELDEREKYWIRNYRANDKNYGYNKTNGGKGYVLNEEVKQLRIKKIQEGRKKPENIKRREERAQARRLERVKQREEYLKTHPKALTVSKPVVQISESGEVVKIWRTSSGAAESVNGYRSGVNKCCGYTCNQQKYKGYYWRFLIDIIDTIPTTILTEFLTDMHITKKQLMDRLKINRESTGKGHINNERSKPVAQIDKYTGEVIRIFANGYEVERELGSNFRNTGVNTCCNGKAKSYKGYRWEFVANL